jgi:hypothetical protein
MVFFIWDRTELDCPLRSSQTGGEKWQELLS